MSATTMDLLGVNLAGAEFGSVGQPYGQGYTYPTHAEIDYEAAKGMNVIRLPFLWERLQPTLNGSLDAAELARIDDVVAYAASKGLTVDLDLHDYGNYNGQAVGSAAVPNSAFADFWGKVAGHFAGSSNVIFGLMNEPQQSSAAGWLQSVNGAIAAIRSAGAQQEVLVPGIGYDGAWTWTGNGNAGVIGTGVVDPSNNYAFEVHQYLDSDGSGTHAAVVSADIGVQRLQAITQWAESTGNRLFLGEFGVAADATSLSAMSKMLAYMDQHTAAWQGATYWAAGPWWGNYMYSAEPSNGTDAAQMTVLEQYKHVAAAPPTDAAAAGGTTSQTSSDAGTTNSAASQTSSNPGTTGTTVQTSPGTASPTPSQTSPETTSPTTSQASPAPGTTGPAPPQASPAPGTTGGTTSQESAGPATSALEASAPSTAATVSALLATTLVDAAPVPADAANEATVPAQPILAATPASAIADVSAPLAAVPVAGPTITVDPLVSFAGPRTMVLSGTVSAPLGVTAVDLFEGGTHLGTAAIAPDGTWSLTISLPPGFHTGLSAVATDTAGNTRSAPTNYDLTTVGNRPGARASIDNYDTSGSYLGTTQYNANGSVYLQWTTTNLPHSQTQVSYSSGTSLKQQGLSSLVEIFGAAGRLVAETQTVVVGGTHTLAADGGRDTFVFKPAFGQDLIAGFTASGNAHDTLSLPASAFGSIAAVLNNAAQQGADTVISARNGDTITLQGVAKTDLTFHDLRFHA